MAKSTRTTNRLVALGSVAVLGIYTTGFLRTQSAARQLDDEEQRPRRRAEAMPGTPGTDVVPQAPVSESPSARVTLAPKTMPRETPGAPDAARATAAPQQNTTVTPETGRAPAAVAKARVAPPAVPSSEPSAATAPTSSSEAAPVSAASSTAAVASMQTVTAPLAEGVTSAAAAPPSAPSAAPASSPAKPVYKDGTYTGWGTSRHGDIQASVAIEGGRIVSVTIAQCLTRYSCSWIAALPPQVIARQSPETDYVSGATQSTNALYYAVVEALAKAK